MAAGLKANGWTVQIEAPIGGGRQIDLVAEKNGQRIAVELETGSAREGMVANIRKCLEAQPGYDEVGSVAVSEAVADKLRADCRPANLPEDRIRITSLPNFQV